MSLIAAVGSVVVSGAVGAGVGAPLVGAIGTVEMFSAVGPILNFSGVRTVGVVDILSQSRCAQQQGDEGISHG